MAQINYIKRTNRKLFRDFQLPQLLNVSSPQNYIPLYDNFFSLTNDNSNTFNLNNENYIKSVDSKTDSGSTVMFNCTIGTTENELLQDTKPIYFKMAPLFDPAKLLIGEINDDNLIYTLPVYNDPEVSHKIINVTLNSSYVDGFFSYLVDSLIKPYNFIHGVQFYGSFLGIKHDFIYNIIDDIDDLGQSRYFINNRNKMYIITDEFMEDVTGITDITPLIITNNESTELQLDSTLEDWDFSQTKKVEDDKCDILDTLSSINTIQLQPTSDQLDLTEFNFPKRKSPKSPMSICDDDTSNNTNKNDDDDIMDNDDNNSTDYDSDEYCDDNSLSSHTHTDIDTDDNDTDNDECSEHSGDFSEYNSSCDDIDEMLITINKFPVQVIAQEKCEDNFDSLIKTGELTPPEWYSALMQIIMILITYQKMFKFTHNDLHSNNIMYVNTPKQYIYYRFNNQYYKVPTFGRIYKLIDFGRSIYTVNGHIICSDGFSKYGSAYTQYNTEPFFDENLTRIDPNYSFDLCRLASSIYIDLVPDPTKVGNLKLSGIDAVARIIVDWCKDDKDKCVLFKSTGEDRYINFKLYKMIARDVHRHTPQVQLERPEFKQYCISKKSMMNSKNNKKYFIDIDKMPDMTNKC